MNTSYILELTNALGHNIAFLLALTFAYSLFRPSLKQLPLNVRSLVEGILFGVFAIAIMLAPLMIAPGVFVDGRGIMLAVAGAFAGWRAAIIAAGLVIVFRILLAGAGVPPAIGAAIGTVFIGSLFCLRSGGVVSWYTSRRLLLLGILVPAQLLLWIFVLPAELVWPTFQTMLLPVMVLYPVGVFLLGTLLVREHQRQDVVEALRESEERYRALFDQNDDGIFIHDQASNILDVNQAACDRLGYSREELLRMKTIDIDALDYGSKFSERLARQLGEGRLHEISGVHIAKDGRHVPIHVNSRAITFKRQTAILAVARDVTELQRAERQRGELEAERARGKMLAEFVRDISHDFRTPLTAIGTAAYLLFRSTDLERRQRHLGTIEGQVQQMTRQLERLLLMAHLDAGRSFKFRPLEVDTLLRNIDERFSSLAQEKGVRLIVEIPDTQPTIQADQEDIFRAVGEMMDNALAFTPSGGVVTLRADGSEDTVIISIQDTGVGIPAVDIPHIFKRLYRGDTARSSERGATGLGLSIAEKIIEGHHGRIEVVSVVGEGSIFRVVLPVAP